MNISSILITIVGIIFILALYVISRVSQSKLPKNQTTLLPDIKDDNGEKFTSVLDDIPASDGSTPIVQKAEFVPDKTEEPNPSNQAKSNKQQVVLFISGKNNAALDGNAINKALTENGLNLGDNDIYHYSVESEQNQLSSLFRIANGIEPWTLTDTDLKDQKITGLSVVLMLPTFIETKDALKIFIEKADLIATQINGVLKNQQQKELTLEEKTSFFNS